MPRQRRELVQQRVQGDKRVGLGLSKKPGRRKQLERLLVPLVILAPSRRTNERIRRNVVWARDEDCIVISSIFITDSLRQRVRGKVVTWVTQNKAELQA